ncbi:MAG: prepilin-type N-terminal cleavage/methylation domain-containing protein [Planctomycetes bacterium]|nr:prepilin-type N-terminal cleavage/methylation domain-containing protein [Planctomycetota bacterium]
MKTAPGRRREHQRGLTMVEVLAATVVVTLLATGVISSISMAYVADRSAQDLITSQNVAREVMESIEVTPFSGLLSLDGAQLNEGEFTAITGVTLISVGLIRVEVLVTHSSNPEIATRAVTLVSDRE